MEASTAAAWWGAIIASVVLLWDVFKWINKGAKVTVSAYPNMQLFDGSELSGDKTIYVEVVNIGGVPTTITHLVVFQYAGLWNRIRLKKSNQGMIPMQGTGQELPHLLGVGERWVGLIDQSDIIEKSDMQWSVYCGVNHTFSKRISASKVRADALLNKLSKRDAASGAPS